MTPPRVVAIIPAAGQSRRMGRPKQLLEVDGRPMLLGLLDTLAAPGITQSIVVTTPAIAQSLKLADVAGVALCFNEDPATEMIDSVRLGLGARLGMRADQSRDREGAVNPEQREPLPAHGAPDGFLICPADHPNLSAADVRACLDAFARQPDRIIIAARDGRRGHPIIIPAALVEFVQSAACDGGLNALPRAMSERVVLVACDSPGILRDVDTPDDYAGTS